jgi:hypothetical protein
MKSMGKLIRHLIIKQIHNPIRNQTQKGLCNLSRYKIETQVSLEVYDQLYLQVRRQLLSQVKEKISL